MLYPSPEASQRDCSDEGSQRMVSMRNKKNYHKILPLIWSSESSLQCLFALGPKETIIDFHKYNAITLYCNGSYIVHLTFLYGLV